MNSKNGQTSQKKQKGIFSEGWVERAKQGLKESPHTGRFDKLAEEHKARLKAKGIK